MVNIQGKVKRTNLLCFIVLISSIPALVQVPPGPPIITSPQVIGFGSNYTLTCTVNGGDPTPTVKWLFENKVIDDSFTTVGSATINEYTFTASKDEHLEVYECQTYNGVLQNPLSRTIFVEINIPPSPPILTGPTDILDGTSNTWTCRSSGAYPQQTMRMRVGNTIFGNNEFTSQELYDRADKSYTKTGILNWVPINVNNGSVLMCDVFHVPTMGPNASQTVMLPLTVRCIYPPVVNSSTDKNQQTVGLAITLNCHVSSPNNSVYSVEWLFTSISNRETDQLVITSSKYSGSSTTTLALTINNVQFSDEGIYRCKVSNLICTTLSKEIFLDVLGNNSLEDNKKNILFAVISTLGVLLALFIILSIVCWLTRKRSETSMKGSHRRGPQHYETPNNRDDPHFYDSTGVYDMIPGQGDSSYEVSVLNMPDNRGSPADYQMSPI